MHKVLLLSVLALGMSACTFTVRPGASVTNTGTTVPVAQANIIRYFAPDRGEGSTYYVGERVGFNVSVSRPGYLTLVSLDPDGYSDVLASNLYVPAGTTFLPRPGDGVNLTLAPPRGLQRVRAIFTAARPSRPFVFSGRYDQNGWRLSTNAYLNSYGVNDRDVYETFFYIR